VLQLRDGAGLKRVSSVALQGEAAERIIETAQQTAGSLIAMCTHGRSGMERWMLGSVADRVVRHGEDPVVIVRPSSDGS
jgi:nucleotide-binding universal stress UspA family protein